MTSETNKKQKNKTKTKTKQTNGLQYASKANGNK